MKKAPRKVGKLAFPQSARALPASTLETVVGGVDPVRSGEIIPCVRPPGEIIPCIRVIIPCVRPR